MPNNESQESQGRHTNEIEDIITAVPSWLIRWGIGLLFFIILLFLFLSYFIRYPDTVKVELKVIRSSNVTPIKVGIKGILEKLLVNDNRSVRAGQPLAYLQSDTNVNSVSRLSPLTRNLKIKDGVDSNTLKKWHEKYILYAPRSGTLRYANMIKSQDSISSGQIVFYITPPGEPIFYGETHISQYNIAKIQKGQEVLIKFHAYPYQEFGITKGKITEIAEDADGYGMYLSRIEFGNIQASDFGKPIRLRSGMLANADIILHNTSLFQRISGNFLNTIN